MIIYIVLPSLYIYTYSAVKINVICWYCFSNDTEGYQTYDFYVEHVQLKSHHLFFFSDEPDIDLKENVVYGIHKTQGDEDLQ